MTQPEALRLADALEISSNHGMRREAAAQLRRLHDDYENALKHFAEAVAGYKQMAAQRDALLEALNEIQDWTARATARAAIAKVEENT